MTPEAKADLGKETGSKLPMKLCNFKLCLFDTVTAFRCLVYLTPNIPSPKSRSEETFLLLASFCSSLSSFPKHSLESETLTPNLTLEVSTSI